MPVPLLVAHAQMMPALQAEGLLTSLRVGQIASGNIGKDDLNAAKDTIRGWQKSAKFAEPEEEEPREWTMEERMDVARAAGFAVEVVSG